MAWAALIQLVHDPLSGAHRVNQLGSVSMWSPPQTSGCIGDRWAVGRINERPS